MCQTVYILSCFDPAPGSFNKCLLNEWFHFNTFKWFLINYLLSMCPAENKAVFVKNQNNKNNINNKKSHPVSLWNFEVSRGIKLGWRAKLKNTRTYSDKCQNADVGLSVLSLLRSWCGWIFAFGAGFREEEIFEGTIPIQGPPTAKL